jgi:hypothetical protein
MAVAVAISFDIGSLCRVRDRRVGGRQGPSIDVTTTQSSGSRGKVGTVSFYEETPRGREFNIDGLVQRRRTLEGRRSATKPALICTRPLRRNSSRVRHVDPRRHSRGTSKNTAHSSVFTVLLFTPMCTWP